MPEEPEAELQATANLSPVSPSPVHTAAPLVVPALQDTVDTIDAMVAAAVASNGDIQPTEAAPAPAPASVPQPGNPHPAAESHHDDDDEIVDDDNDPYGDDDAADAPVVEAPAASEPPADTSNDDDYLKTFDSPINPEEGADDDQGHDQPTNASNGHPLEPSPQQSSAAQLPTQPGDTPVEPERPMSHPEVVAEAEGQAQGRTSADIRQLVADLTAQQHADPSHSDPSVSSAHTANEQSAALPSAASLPPRPPQPNEPSQTFPSQHHPGNPTPGFQAASTPTQAPTYGGGAPGTSTENLNNLPPPPAAAAPPTYSAQAPGYASESTDDDYQRRWEQFVADERQYMSEAKWDRFPEGSRIFIGNLSSDKVSKRDVFDMFHRFGRLAQISLKSAYGFVQYHSVEEGSQAIENLQGIEIKGRRIHLEVSKLQDKSKKDRGRSPDKGRGGRDGGRRNDRNQNQRDEHRGRNHSPRRNDYYQDGYGRDRGSQDYGRGGGRGRSRSPSYGGRNRADSYRRRSPSPYSRSRREDELDLPRRYGADVPDVQILLQADVNRDFVAWVEGAFKTKGLTTHNMFLHPRMPKDQVIQRQAVEGVHAVVDLDMRAQNTCKVPVQAFDRSAGSNNVRFDQYVDLDPPIAAEVILRTKASSVPSYGQPYQGAPPNNYHHNGGYPGHAQQPTPGYNMYGSAPPQPTYAAPPPQHQPPPPQQQAPAIPPELASLVGNVDPATLQRLIATVQQPHGGGATAHTPQGNAPPMGQADLQAILGNLGAGAGAGAHPPQGSYGAPYGGQPPPNGQGGDNAAQVQNIMAQLARYR